MSSPLNPPALVTPILPCVVIYEKPSDQPNWFVVRRWNLGKTATMGEATRHPNLDAARAAVPKGMVNIGRTKDDDPSIVEVWL